MCHHGCIGSGVMVCGPGLIDLMMFGPRLMCCYPFFYSASLTVLNNFGFMILLIKFEGGPGFL